MGPSGSGKTYSIDSGLQFVPPSAIESIAGMSEKALPYLGDSDVSLKNRVLYLGEAAGMAEGNGRTFLRQLLSEGKLQYLTVQKSSGGLKGEKLAAVEGPTSLIMATTANHLHPEDQNRMVVLHMDEDPARTRDGLINQALGLTKAQVPINTDRWFDLYAMVADGAREVDIPYGRKLAECIPADYFQISRDFGKVLGLLKTHALIHQRTRERNEAGAVIATHADYEAIYGLLDVPLAQGIGESVRPGIRRVVEAVAGDTRVKMPEYGKGISQTRVAELTGMERSVVNRNVQAAIEEGFLINSNPGQGREAKLEVGERNLPSGKVLPTPAQVFDSEDAAAYETPRHGLIPAVMF